MTRLHNPMDILGKPENLCRESRSNGIDRGERDDASSVTRSGTLLTNVLKQGQQKPNLLRNMHRLQDIKLSRRIMASWTH